MARGGVPASERARRLVALLGQLTTRSRISIAELAAELGSTEAELATDLETLAMCGVAPYGPGDLVPIFIEDGIVEVWGEMPALRGPVRLSAAEARALASALQAAGRGPDDALTVRLLDAAGGGGFDAEELARTIRATSSAHEVNVFETVAAAIESGEVVQLEYVRGGDEKTTVRDVEPIALFAERGAWYLTAWCQSAADWRTFRVDRIRVARLTGERFDAGVREATLPGSAFTAEGLPKATLRFAPEEPFSEREWPGASVAEKPDDGPVVARVPYGATGWVARQVVARLGSVEVLEPAEVREEVRLLATRLLSAGSHRR